MCHISKEASHCVEILEEEQHITRTLEDTKAVAVALLNEFGEVVKKKGDYDVRSGVVREPTWSTVEKEVESSQGLHMLL